MQGHWCRLDRLDPTREADGLYTAFTAATDASDWDYLPYGPFSTGAAFRHWLDGNTGDDPLFYAVLRLGDAYATGLAALMRTDVANGVTEIGHIHFARPLQRTAAATEAIFLMMSHVFHDLGYRRLEWKCDAANARSMRAAERFGFTLEGTFRQHRIVKGSNRDTAWFSVLDHEWPSRKQSFQRWLDPSNFDDDGRQLAPLRMVGR